MTPEKAASNKRWKDANRDKMRKYRADWRARNPEKSRECTAAWARENPAAKKEKDRKWYEANREYSNARSVRWQKENADRAAATHRAWKRANPDKVCLYTRRRKAKKLAAGGIHTAEDVAVIRRSQKGKCAYCRVGLKSVKSHVDHIFPLALGGDNSRSNLQILCMDCNLTKGSLHPVDYARRTGRLI